MKRPTGASHTGKWIFTHDGRAKTALLCGGDVDWNTRMEVVDGRVPGLVMQQDEVAWLRRVALATGWMRRPRTHVATPRFGAGQTGR